MDVNTPMTSSAVKSFSATARLSQVWSAAYGSWCWSVGDKFLFNMWLYWATPVTSQLSHILPPRYNWKNFCSYKAQAELLSFDGLSV